MEQPVYEVCICLYEQDLLVVHMAVDRITHQYNTISPNYGGDDCDGNGDKT